MSEQQQAASGWRQTACNLCYINCGIEVITEGRRMIKIRGDKLHPDTKGYACQKAQRLDYYQNQADRLTTPLRRRADGRSLGTRRSARLRSASITSARLTAAMHSRSTEAEGRAMFRAVRSRFR